MTRQQSTAERPDQAVFSVCMDEADVATTTSTTSKLVGAHFAGEFRDYITSDKRPQFSTSLKSAASCVALIDFDRDPELALQTTERLSQIFLKKISIVGVGTEPEASILVRAMRNGCTEFLTKPIDSMELINSLARFHSVMAIDPQAHSGIGRVIAFFGAKGGVGTTILAVHLATHLVRQHGKKTLLIDHKQQLGHVALYLGLKEAQYHFDELLRNADHLDAELLNGFVMHHRSGLDIIASPDLVKGSHEPKADQLENVMDFLRREYDFVLIDSSVASADSKSSVIDQADEVYIVATPDVAALRDLARMVENLSTTESAIGKLNVVVNRSTAADSITPEEVEKAVRFPVTISVPNNYLELQHAINEGEPVSPQRRSEFNQAMTRWATRVTQGVAGPSVAPLKNKLFAFFS